LFAAVALGKDLCAYKHLTTEQKRTSVQQVYVYNLCRWFLWNSYQTAILGV